MKIEKNGSGIGLVGALGIAFIVLKLLGVINWSWWWVLSPFWISVGLVLIAGIIYVCIEISDKKGGWR